VLGIALSLRIVAFVLLSPVFGAYAHRLPRRRVLVTLDLVRAATVLCLPWVDAVWQIYLLILVISAASAGFTPLFQATIPDVLPDEAAYTRALSLSRLAYDLQQLLAPALAGLLLLFLPLNALFALNGVAFLVSAALVLSVTLPRARDVLRPEGVLANLGWGLRLYLATPRLRGLLALSMAVAAARAMVIVNTVVYVQGVLGGGEAAVTLAFAVSGGGSMLAALLLPKALDRLAERSVMLMGGALMAAAMAAGTLLPGLPGLLAIWFAIGVGGSLVQTPAGRLLRRSADAGGECTRPILSLHQCRSHAEPAQRRAASDGGPGLHHRRREGAMAAASSADGAADDGCWQNRALLRRMGSHHAGARVRRAALQRRASHLHVTGHRDAALCRSGDGERLVPHRGDTGLPRYHVRGVHGRSCANGDQ
jgi:MFS family permease